MPEASGQVITLLIGEASPLFRHGLALLLATDGDFRVVAHAGDAAAVVRMAGQAQPDVVLIDSELATTETLEKLCGAGLCGGRVVVVGEADAAAVARRVLLAGASAFVCKHSKPDELLEAVRRAARGGRYLDPALGVEVTQRRGEEAAATALTIRQREVLRLLGMGMTNREVAAELGVSVRTVEAHRRGMQLKLGLHTRAEIVRYARRQGFTALAALVLLDPNRFSALLWG